MRAATSADARLTPRAAQHSTYFVLLQLKMAYLSDVLSAGHDVLLVDADVVFLADVQRLLSDMMREHDLDVVVQSDARSGHNETADWLCAGFIAARARAATVALFAEAERVMAATGAPDQDVLQLLFTGHAQWYLAPCVAVAAR